MKIEIVGLDLQPDGGTHVATTRAVGGIMVTGNESKGRINKRMRLVLEDYAIAAKPKRTKAATGAQTIGGILAGLDQQIMRNMPPAQELVARGQPARAVSGDGIEFEVTFPVDLEKPSPAPADGGTHGANTRKVG